MKEYIKNLKELLFILKEGLEAVVIHVIVLKRAFGIEYRYWARRFKKFVARTTPKEVKNFLRVNVPTFFAAPFIVYFINLVVNTLKFESTFLILFFLIFINLLYVNIYSYIVVELDKYSFNMYLSYKETVARRIKRIKSNLAFFKVRKNKLSSIVKRFSKAVAVSYVNNYNHFKIFADFTLIFFVHNFVSNLTSTQLNLKKA